MTDPVSAAGAVSAALNLLNSILNLIRTSRQNGTRLALPEVLASLPGEAAKLADVIANRLDEVEQSMTKADIDLGQPMGQLEEDIGYWRRRFYRIPASLTAEMNGIAAALSNLVNDFVALANCREAEEELAISFKNSRPLRDEIRKTVNPDRPFKEIIAELRKHAHDLRDAFRDLR